MLKDLLAALAMAAYIGAAIAGLNASLERSEGAQPAEAQCSTDSECMVLCRPDDEECDGGPEDAPITNIIIGVRA